MRFQGMVLFFLLAVSAVHSTETRAATDAMACMRTRLDPGNASSAPFLTLPFYQPSVDGRTIDGVVTDVLYPASNAFVLHDSWRSPSGLPMIPIVNWRMQEYTGFAMDDLANGQRGHVDAYAKSGEQLAGRRAGFWMNTQNEDAVLSNGSLSTNLGCWYQEAPFARLFTNVSQVLDVSFDTGVHYQASAGGGHSQAYFQLIVKDLSGQCGNACAFSISVGYFGPDGDGGLSEITMPDDTHTTDLPLAVAVLESPHWISRASDSMYSQRDTFPEGRVHFSLSPAQLILIRDNVANTLACTGTNTCAKDYSHLSRNPLDYGVTLINVNGEIYNPCKSDHPPTGCPGPYAQLGMTVANMRVTATTPHVVTGVPSAGSSGLVFRNQNGELYSFSTGLGPSGPVLEQVGSQLAADDPAVTTGQGAQRIYFIDATHHVHEAWRTGSGWQTWDLTTGLGIPDAYSAPHAYTAADGSVRVYYRDIQDHVHQLRLDAGGWSTADLTTLAGAQGLPAAIGGPVGYQAGSADRVVYRGVGNQVVELYFWDGHWQAWNMSTVAGAVQAATDPRPFVDAQGVARVIYRDIAGTIHQLSTTSQGWQDANLSDPVHAVAALGSPMGFVAEGAVRIVYRGVDQHLHQLILSQETWTHSDMGVLDGAFPLADDPQGYVGSDGAARIDYPGADHQLHEFFYQGEWLHRDL